MFNCVLMLSVTLYFVIFEYNKSGKKLWIISMIKMHL
jgi:hypothetical protein